MTGKQAAKNNTWSEQRAAVSMVAAPQRALTSLGFPLASVALPLRRWCRLVSLGTFSDLSQSEKAAYHTQGYDNNQRNYNLPISGDLKVRT